MIIYDFTEIYIITKILAIKIFNKIDGKCLHCMVVHPQQHFHGILLLVHWFFFVKIVQLDTYFTEKNYYSE